MGSVACRNVERENLTIITKDFDKSSIVLQKSWGERLYRPLLYWIVDTKFNI